MLQSLLSESHNLAQAKTVIVILSLCKINYSAKKLTTTVQNVTRHLNPVKTNKQKKAINISNSESIKVDKTNVKLT